MRIVKEGAEWWSDMHSMSASVSKSDTIEITDAQLDEIEDGYMTYRTSEIMKYANGDSTKIVFKKFSQWFRELISLGKD